MQRKYLEWIKQLLNLLIIIYGLYLLFLYLWSLYDRFTVKYGPYLALFTLAILLVGYFLCTIVYNCKPWRKRP